MAKKNVDSRNLNKAKDFDAYLASFDVETEKPNTKKKGEFTEKSLVTGEVIKKITSKKDVVQGRKTVKKKTFSSLIPPNFKCDVESRRITDIFTELRILKVDRFPNSVAILLRSLLDMSLGYYLDKTGRIAELLNKERAKNNRSKDWHPTLKQMISYIVNSDPAIELNPLAMKVLNKLISDKESMFSAETLDFFVHNTFYCPNEDQLRGFWESLQEIFRITLTEPTIPEK